MPDKLTITKEDQSKVQADIVSSFEIPEFGRKYIIYTFNEKDPNGLAKLNVSQIEDNSLIRVQTDDEWNRIKDVMRDMVKGQPTNVTYFSVENTEMNVANDGFKIIALKEEAIPKMKEVSSNSLNTVAQESTETPEIITPEAQSTIEPNSAAISIEQPETPVVEEPVVDAPAEETTPVAEETNTNDLEAPVSVDIPNGVEPAPSVVAGATFQTPPADLTNTPLNDIVTPTVENEESPVQKNVEAPAEEVTPVVETPTENDIVAPINVDLSSTPETPVVEEPVVDAPAEDTLSDAELIRQINDLLNKSSIKQEETKKMIMSNVNAGLYLSKVIERAETVNLEAVDVAKKTSDIAKVNQQAMQQNIAQEPVQEGPVLQQVA